MFCYLLYILIIMTMTSHHSHQIVQIEKVTLNKVNLRFQCSIFGSLSMLTIFFKWSDFDQQRSMFTILSSSGGKKLFLA